MLSVIGFYVHHASLLNSSAHLSLLSSVKVKERCLGKGDGR